MGVVTHVYSDPSTEKEVRKLLSSRTSLEGTAVEGDSPVGEREKASWRVVEYHGTREILWESGGTTLQG